MRALLQRVKKGSVTVDDQVVGKIGSGLVILLGVRQGDTEEDAAYLAQKCASLRIFADEAGKFNRSLLDVNGEALVVSQFTLYADTRKGRRPSFIEAAPPEVSEPLYESFMRYLRELGVHVKHGVFGAMMDIEILNDGPVTLMVESKRG